MILSTGKENVSMKNSHVLTTGKTNVGTANSTVLKEVSSNSWCFSLGNVKRV
jgi:hypothetical protein